MRDHTAGTLDTAVPGITLRKTSKLVVENHTPLAAVLVLAGSVLDLMIK